MSYSSISYVPVRGGQDNVSTASLIATLSTSYDNYRHIGTWTLVHHLFRETASNPSESAGAKVMQVFNCSLYPTESFIGITHLDKDAPTNLVSSLSSGPFSSEFLQMTVTKMLPLWAPRQASAIADGQACAFGPFVVRIGDFKQGSGPQQQMRGVMVMVEWVGKGSLREAQTMHEAFWSGLSNVKHVETTRIVATSEVEAQILLWFEALRMPARAMLQVPAKAENKR